MMFPGIPSKYLGPILLRVAQGSGPAPDEDRSCDEVGRDSIRRADLNEEIARASLGSEVLDYLALLSQERDLPPDDGVPGWLGRRLGVTGG